MEKSEYYKNNYPLEDLLEDLNDSELNIIVRDCEYTIECDKIAVDMDADCVNTSDAVVFYKMGYEHAKSIIEKKLSPHK